LNSIAAISDLIGMVGVSLVLIAFSLLNLNKLTSHHMIYQMMNLIGSVFLLFSLCFHWNLSSVVIEIAWMTISVFGILRILKARRVVREKSTMTDLVEDIVLSCK